MKQSGRWIRILTVLIAAVLAGVLLTSCSSEKSAGKFLVYYVNDAEDNIVSRSWEIENPEELTCAERTEMLLNMMFETDLAEQHVHPAKPENVQINHFKAEEDMVTFDFSSEYLEMTNVQEILLRAALVLTMIQQSDVTQVMFTIEGQPLTDSTGEEIGRMERDNFVDILLNEDDMLKQETDLTIYFTDETGSRLIPAKYHFRITNNNSSAEEYILQQLKTGPAIDATFRTMAEDVEIISVLTRDQICTVNFGSNFLEQNQPASDEIMLYSIVNSLCDLNYVKSVQFLVDGRSDVKLHGITDLSTPFRPNKSLEQ